MNLVSDWLKYAPYFTETEFRCKHTGMCKMRSEFMDVLLKVRREYDRSMKISSGYRHPTHPVEAKKGWTTGEHTTGWCCDVAVTGGDALLLVQIALKHGITRIGVQQKGAGRFIHLGMSPRHTHPTIWSY